jgi:peptide chain release factor subunit 1
MIEKSVVAELSSYKESENPVTSAYITVDNNAESRGKHILELKDMIQYKKNTSYFKELTEEEQNSVLKDFEKILEWVKNSFDSKEFNSVIIFSSEKTGYWKTILLKQRLQNQIEIHTKPFIRPLTTLFDDYRKYAVVLVDKAKGRILESNYGEFSEVYSFKEEDIESMKTGGFMGTEERKIERSNKKSIVEHYKKIAEEILRLDQKKNYNWIIIGGRKESIRDFEQYLHNYVKQKISGNLIVEPSANINDVLQAVKKTEKEARSRFEKHYLKLLNTKKQQNLAAEGIEEIISAAKAQQIDTLFIKENFKIKGRYCKNDDFITAEMIDKCPECGADLERTDDLVEHLLHKMLNQSAKIKYVNGTLDDRGKIAAYLRFPKMES